jgi:hypothetical protein
MSSPLAKSALARTIAAASAPRFRSLFAAFAPLRYDRDLGPVRLVIVAQLGSA